MTSVSCVLVMFHLIPTAGTIQVVLSLPIMVQEMVLAVWLIAKGINSSAVAPRAANMATNELLGAA